MRGNWPVHLPPGVLLVTNVSGDLEEFVLALSVDLKIQHKEFKTYKRMCRS